MAIVYRYTKKNTYLCAIFDLSSHLYVDVIIQGEDRMNKNGAFNKLSDRHKSINKPIFIADRGFESLNSFVHVMKSENKYPIHIKDIASKTSVARSFGLPKADEFNVDVKRILTIRNTNEIKA